jgi:hypothetical protein
MALGSGQLPAVLINWDATVLSAAGSLQHNWQHCIALSKVHSLQTTTHWTTSEVQQPEYADGQHIVSEISTQVSFQGYSDSLAMVRWQTTQRVARWPADRGC